MKVLPVGQFQEFAETLIAAIVAERCGMEGQKALIQMNAAQQLMGVGYYQELVITCSQLMCYCRICMLFM